MDEAQLNEILSSYRDAINALMERLDAQDDMVKALKEQTEGLNHLVFDEVLTPAKQAMDEYNYNTGLDEFSGKYGDKLSGYNDKLRPIEGEDFDIVKQAYDGYNDYEGEKPDEGMYVDELIKQVDAQLDEIRKAVGAADDAQVAVVDNGEGEPEVQVDGEPVAEADEAAPAEEPVEEEVVEGEEETDPEDLKKLEEELEKYAK